MEIERVQHLSRFAGEFQFRMSEEMALRCARRARLCLGPDEASDRSRWPAFTNAELFNPYFSERFWRKVLRLGAGMPSAYFESLALDIVSATSTAVRGPVRHLVSSWRHQDARIAGAMFVSDVSFFISCGAPVPQILQIGRDTIIGLLARHFDILTIGFEVPTRMVRISQSVAKHAPWLETQDFRVFRADAAQLEALRTESHTANVLTSLMPGADYFVIDQCRGLPGTWRFVAFTYCVPGMATHLASAEFWRGAIAPLVADSVRTVELSRVPGQRSRFRERRQAAEAASAKALGLLDAG
jgi:hypothetical protein